MSESDSDQHPGGEPRAISVNETPSATPEPEDRTPANRIPKVLPLSPAWIKAKKSDGNELTTIGYDVRNMNSGTDVVLFSIPNGARLEDLQGKAVMLPSQAGARAIIEGYGYETVRGPDQSQKDLHLLCMLNGVAMHKPVSEVYSLQIPLADVPADEEPVEDSILDAIQEALPGSIQNSIARLHSKKKRKSKHGRLSRLTGNAQEHDGPQVTEETAAAAAPPDTYANVETAERTGSKRSQRQGRGHSAGHAGAANGEDAATAGEADAQEPSGRNAARKKKKKKKKRSTEGAPDVPGEAAHKQRVEGAAGEDVEMAAAEDVAMDAPGTGTGEAAEEQHRRDSKGKKRKQSKHVGAVLQAAETNEVAESPKKKKQKRVLSMEGVDASVPVSPLVKKQKKKKRKSQPPNEAD